MLAKKGSSKYAQNYTWYIWLNLFIDKSTWNQKYVSKSLHFEGREGGVKANLEKKFKFRFFLGPFLKPTSLENLSQFKMVWIESYNYFS